MDRKKVILDCDPGMDDSMAIVMAAKSDKIDLLAVTTVNGNYPAVVTAKNARKILELIDRRDIPVAMGMSEPMVRPVAKDPFTHGTDGLANANLPEPTMELEQRHAVNLIIDTIKKYPHEVTLICTAPLSNIGMAFKMAPEIKPLVKEIIAISGAFGLNQASFLNATGDTPQSEWNVYVDPEASKVVYESGVPFKAIGLDIATYFNVDFTDNDVSLFESSEKKEANFIANAINFVKGNGYGAYCTCIDCMAVAYAIDENLVRFKKALVSVITDDGPCLGMTVRDGRHHHIWKNLPEVDIAVDADYRGFLNMLRDLLLK